MRQCVLGASLWQVNGLMAEALVKTPKSTEGPFYPDTLPLDTDNDLLIINDSINPGVGQVTWLSGRILDAHGQPVRNAMVEIWQCDGKGGATIIRAVVMTLSGVIPTFSVSADF